MVRQLQFAVLWIGLVVPGLAAVRLLQRRLVNAVARPSIAPVCAGMGPLKVTSTTINDHEVLVRLDDASAQAIVQPFVVGLATGTNETDQLVRWQRRNTLVWLQQDASDPSVVAFAGSRRVVLELWAGSHTSQQV